jgi:hypothetical protein
MVGLRAGCSGTPDCGLEPPEKQFPSGFFFVWRMNYLGYPKTTSSFPFSDRHLARFERVSPLTLSMGAAAAAALCIALVISKSSLSKVIDHQVEIMGHGTILDGSVA